MFRPIRMDHTNCLQVAIKTLQYTNWTDIEPLIKDLDLDISHWKNMKKYKTYH